MTDEIRTEEQVLEGMTANEKALLRRVLEIEMAKLHVTSHDPTDSILDAVKGIIP